MSDKRSSSDSVPPGYKCTEVGVIPEDWEIKRLGEIGTGIIGLTYSPREISYEGTLVLRASNIGENSLVFDDNVFVKSEIPDNLLVRKNDLLICVRNGSRNLIGKSALIDKDYENMTFGAFMTVFRSESNPFIFYCFQSDLIRHQIHAHLGATINQITNKSLNSFIVPLPPLPEQRAIAQALADADAWIEALDRLIAKKRAIKRAAMGDLLTGRVRLPGFSDEWVEKRLGDLAGIVSGGTPSTLVKEYWDGDIPWCTPTDITSNEGKYLFSTKRTISELGLQNSSATLLPAKTLLLCTRATIGEMKIAGNPIATNQGFKSLVVYEDKAAPEFLYYHLQLRKEEIAALGVGSTFLEVSRKDIAEFLISLPALAEQQAIARVLSEMDAEIEALERERDKARAIKQGMMQELLTGRIRLVERAPATQSDQIARKSKGRNEAFLEAVLLSVITQRFSNKRYPIGRFRRTKLVYLLRRHIQAGVSDYLKQAAGPYRPKTKYGYAEKIARRRQYVQTHQCEDRKGFIPGPRVHEAEHYFEKWYGREPLQWMEQFRYRKNEDLELLTTVDMAMGELQAAGKPVHVAGIKTLIAESEIWRAKLERPIFSDIKIARAMREIRQFFPDR